MTTSPGGADGRAAKDARAGKAARAPKASTGAAERANGGRTATKRADTGNGAPARASRNGSRRARPGTVQVPATAATVNRTAIEPTAIEPTTVEPTTVEPTTVERGRAARRAGANGHRPTVASPPTADAAAPTAALAPEGPDIWEQRVADLLAFLRRRITGQYDVDEFGFDPELTDTVFYPLLRLLYRHYFRVEVSGVQNLPDGCALLVANHSGTLPVDALMLSIAVHDETPGHRHLRLLAADLVLRVPILSELARKGGATMACNPDARRLLGAGEYVGVFPEGFKGIGKHYRDRYKLQRFGRGGFVSAAVRTGAPIVPVAIVGAEEIFPIVGNIGPLAKVLGLPYVPVTPLFPWFGPLGMLPLPSKWLIEFGEPIPTTDLVADADDPIVIFNLADQVRETIQQTLHTLLQRRPDPFG